MAAENKTKKKQSLKPKTGTRKPKSKVPIVAIGASAGGLEPYEKFFDSMSANSGLAFVIIQHLSPDFESMMDELLARHSTMNIRRVEDGMRLEPNTIFLNTPRVDMTIDNGYFRASPAEPSDRLNLPIDLFFSSLADEYGSKAIAIVLSGTGSDGTRGAATVKEKGGVVLVQAPNSAKFAGMPQSVIDQELADAVALPELMPALLDKIQRGESLTDEDHQIANTPVENALLYIRNRFGTDFGYYKPTTILRRLSRRAKMKGTEVPNYVESLNTDITELDALYSDLLIDVTFFFRDPEAFESLIKLTIEPLCEIMDEERQIRVWVPGCATGAEAYSIAIAFAEYARENSLKLNLKILATDVHQRSLGAATEGLYREDTLKGMPPDLLERYFQQRGNQYQVNQDVRRLIVFSQHNILRDPPFTRLDLISCRNVLIYFKSIAQKKTLELFHFGLNLDAYLFLGPSESLTSVENEFSILSRRWRIFKKKRDVRLIGTSLMLPRNSAIAPATLIRPSEPFDERPTRSREFSRRRAHEEALELMLSDFAPPGFLLNKIGEILHVFGDAGKFISVESGAFRNHVSGYLRSDLQFAVNAGLDRIGIGGHGEFRRSVLLKDDDGSSRIVQVEMKPVAINNGEIDYILLTLITADSEKVKSNETGRTVPAGALEPSPAQAQRIAELERELTSTEESLQSIVEELQTSNEELQATNEELMASNEELQSTNEELHSVNEELYTVSTEHQLKIDELTVANTDMDHLLMATSIGIIFLDKEACIRRFTPTATEAFNLLDHDIGRPLAHVTAKFSDNIDIDTMVSQALKGEQSEEVEIILSKKDYIFRVLPYKKDEWLSDGAVLTLIDVSSLKTSERKRLAAQEIYRSIVDNITENIVRWDAKTGEIVFCNQPFSKLAGMETSQMLGRTLREVGAEAGIEPLTGLDSMRPNEQRTDTIFVKREGKLQGYSRQVKAIPGKSGEVELFQGTGMEVTDQLDYTGVLERLLDSHAFDPEDTDQVLDNLLKIGFDYFGMSTATLCKSEAGKYVEGRKLNYADRAPSVIKKLSKKDAALANFIAQKPVAIDDLLVNQPEGWGKKDLPEVGSVIGGPVAVGAEHYGVIFFSDSERHYRKFTRNERSMLKLLARIIGLTIDRDEFVRKIKDANTDLEELNESLNRFAFIASHDLQEPLRKVLQFGELLEEENTKDLTEDALYYLSVIRSSAKRMRDLLRDLLEFSSMTEQKLELKNTDLNGIVEDVVADLRPVIEDAQVDVKIGNMPTVKCDGSVVSHIFQNLLANAIKYRHPDRPPEVKMFSRATKDGLKITVQDNGIGIDNPSKNNIFEPFVRLHSNDDYKGSGIGLSICRSICDRHGWTIGFQNRKTGGSNFFVLIPQKPRKRARR